MALNLEFSSASKAAGLSNSKIYENKKDKTVISTSIQKQRSNLLIPWACVEKTKIKAYYFLQEYCNLSYFPRQHMKRILMSGKYCHYCPVLWCMTSFCNQCTLSCWHSNVDTVDSNYKTFVYNFCYIGYVLVQTITIRNDI